MSEVLNAVDKDSRAKVIVRHPDFGHVVFSSPTPRQVEILRKYAELTDTTFGALEPGEYVPGEIDLSK